MHLHQHDDLEKNKVKRKALFRFNHNYIGNYSDIMMIMICMNKFINTKL